MTGFEEMAILLAEDSDQDAELTLRALRRGNILNKVARVKDGAEAIDFLFRNGDYAARSGANPRLVLLDLKMPKMNGIEVLEAIRSNERTRTIPVVVLTSSAEEPDMVESYRLGVNSYLVKPVETEKFIDVVTRTGHYWMLMNRTPPLA